MASTFPKLKTGAVTQYPSQRSYSFATEVLRFVDGTEQRFREQPEVNQAWLVRLDLLDDSEAAALERFFEAMQGCSGRFSFEDPRDGTTHDNCSFGSDELMLENLGHSRTRTSIRIIKNRA